MGFFEKKRNIILISLVCVEFLVGLIIIGILNENIQHTWIAPYIHLSVFVTLHQTFRLHARDLDVKGYEQQANRYYIVSRVFLGLIILSIILAILATREKFFL